MKHLKTYKLFESVSEEIIRQILFDISDNDIFNLFIEENDSCLEVFIQTRNYQKLIRQYLSGDVLDPNYQPLKREIPGAPVPPPEFVFRNSKILANNKFGSGGGYPSDIFLWFEIKDTIIRLCEYVYSETEFTPGINSKAFSELRNMGIKYESNSPFRMFSGGNEFGIGWCKEEDFTLGDFISFTSLKLIIKL